MDLGLRLDRDWCKKLSVTIVIMLTIQLHSTFWRGVKEKKIPLHYYSVLENGTMIKSMCALS